MAIVKTTFDSGSSNISQVAAWLQANATDYFDEITLANSIITCTKDGHTALEIRDTSDSRYTFYTSSGQVLGVLGYQRPLFGVLTSKGLFIRSVGLPNSSYYNMDDIFITKTDSGELAFVMIALISEGSNSYARYYAFAFDAPSITYYLSSGTSPEPYYIPKYLTFFDDYKTAMSNVVCKNTDSYTPDVYRLTHSEYSYDTTGIITLDDKQYFTNGCFVLAD